jgi:acyl-CoA thioester hydrolase
MTKDIFTRFYDIETRWYDEDMLGHLNHGTAVNLIEDVRVRHAADIGLEPYDRYKFPFIVASMKLDYLKQISYPEKLTIGIRVSRVGGKSFDYEYGVFIEGEDKCAITCHMTLVCFDFANQKSVPVFDALKNEL